MVLKSIQILTQQRKPESGLISKTKSRDIIFNLVKNNIQQVFDFRYETNRKKITEFFINSAKEIAKERKQELNEEQFTTLLNNVLFSKIKEYELYEKLEDVVVEIIPTVAAINSIEHFINNTHAFIQNMVKTTGVKHYRICCDQIKMFLKDGSLVLAEARNNNKYKYVVTDRNKKVLFNTIW